MPTATHEAAWDARIARARELASSRPAARDLLTFYAALAEYQRALAASARDLETLDVEDVVETIPGFLAWLRQNGRSDLAASVHVDSVASALRACQLIHCGFRLQPEGRVKGSNLLDSRSLPPESGSHESEGGSHEPDDPAALFVIESLLQAFAEVLPSRDTPALGSMPMRCPHCAALPVAAVLREEGQGAKRFLLCALCLQEWECLRIVCPACGEQDFDTLPVYTAEQFSHVRIDACDRCHHYVKTIDLTKDGLAVPCVDDIASVSLDLWARERGYTRIKRNVLGI
jgi:formate dehydrogenase maturation protein FdhE